MRSLHEVQADGLGDFPLLPHFRSHDINFQFQYIVFYFKSNAYWDTAVIYVDTSGSYWT